MISLFSALQIARHSNGGLFVLETKEGTLKVIKGHPDNVPSMVNLVAFIIPSIDGIFFKSHMDPTADWEFRVSGQFDGSECPILVYKDQDVVICKDGGGRFCIFNPDLENHDEDEDKDEEWMDGYCEESNPMDSSFFLEEGDDGGFLYR